MPSSMVNLAYRLYWQAEKVLTPGLRYSQYSYEDVLSSLVNPCTVWLDVGCGYQVLPGWRCKTETELVNRAAYVAGVDMDVPAMRKHRTIKNTWIGSAETLPFPDASFNLITANMVVEHLADPSRAFTEIGRVLTPDGIFLFHTPNVEGYVHRVNQHLPKGMKRLAAKLLDGRDADDVYPTHYRCNSEQAILRVAASSGLGVKEIRFVPSTAIFARVLPLAACELLWIRATMHESRYRQRTNILGLLSKPQ